MKKLVSLAIVGLTLLLVLGDFEPASAQGPKASGAQVGKPWRGAPGVTESVAKIMDRERRAPLKPSQPRALRPRRTLKAGTRLPGSPLNPATLVSPQRSPQTGRLSLPRSPQTLGTSFLGAQVSESNLVPPDSMGDVGPTQVLVVVNGRIKVFDKSGTLGGLNADLTVFFASVLGPSATLAFDPQTRYDRLSGRWFVVALDDGDLSGNNNRLLIAVSSGSTITDGASFTFFYFQHNLVGGTPNDDTGKYADYDSLGVDKNSLYIGVNIYGSTDVTATGFVVNKSDLLVSTLTVTAFRSLFVCNPSCSNGPFSPRGVHNDDPLATEGYFIGVDRHFFSLLALRRITYSGSTPAISGNIFVNVPSTYNPMSGVPAQGTSTSLDDLDDRLFLAQIHTNKLNGAKSLWTAHNVRVDSGGFSSEFGDRDGSRWYELRDLSTTPSLYQYGTLFDTAASDPRYFWIPSVAMSGQGHMALGASTAGVGRYAEIATAGQLSSDPLNTTAAFTLAQSSTSPYDVTIANPQRWGDYSQTVVDPNDDMTMWTFQEYANAANSWGVQVIQLIAPPPAKPISSSPNTVATGLSSVSVVLTGASVSGSGFFDPGADSGGPGFTNHITATVGGGVVVNSITFNSPTQVTLDLSTVSASAGSPQITVTNPDGQSATGDCILNVTDGVTPLIACNSYYLPVIFR